MHKKYKESKPKESIMFFDKENPTLSKGRFLMKDIIHEKIYKEAIESGKPIY